jgi:hypothetical protein
MADYKEYAIRSGRSVVGTRQAVSAREAALDYLRARGCSPDEITSYGSDGVAWRGAVYRAEAVALSDRQAKSSQAT